MHGRAASRRRDGRQASAASDRRVGLAGGPPGRWSRELLEAALSRSDSIQGLTAVDGRPQSLTESDELRRLVRHPSAYFIDYADGTRATLLMLDGAVADYTFAARLRGSKPSRIHPVSLASQPKCRLLSLPDAQGRGNARDRSSPLPCRADLAGERDARELSRVENPGEPTDRNSTSRRPISFGTEVAVLPDMIAALGLLFQVSMSVSNPAPTARFVAPVPRYLRFDLTQKNSDLV